MGFSFSTSASEAAAIVKQGESGVGKSEPRAVSHLERVERGHGGGGVGRVGWEVVHCFSARTVLAVSAWPAFVESPGCL